MRFCEDERMARKLTVGRAPSGHPLRGSGSIARGGPSFIGARGSQRSAGNGRVGGKKILTRGSGRLLGRVGGLG